ncbi:MAG: hypothetical protein GTO13_18475 [Proteobacteria bacterium]|nr:hypothetical protein [Pseudomonadota bacterium]
MKTTRMIYLFLAVQVVFFAGCVGKVPIGGVIDWYRPNASFPIPNDYMVADGSTVTDPESPLFNESLPDLRSIFVRGAAALNEIGTRGGSASHQHALNVPAITTSQVAESDHNHMWAMFNRSTNTWKTFSGSTEVVLVDWGDGIDSEGSGVWPLGFDEENRPSGTGWYYLTTGKQSGIQVHHHNVEFSGDITMENSPNEPPYVMLLKIVRIK